MAWQEIPVQSLKAAETLNAFTSSAPERFLSLHRTIVPPAFVASTGGRRSRALVRDAENCFSQMFQWDRRLRVSSGRDSMLNLLQSASDDQVALLGCVGALAAAGMLMYLSYFIGPARRREQAIQQTPWQAAPQPLRRAEDRAA
jgi:hypothetical protein